MKNKQTKIKRIFLDVDGVLADFETAALKLWGLTGVEAQEVKCRGHLQGDNWDMIPRLSAVLDQQEPMTFQTFWSKIVAEGPSFWTRLLITTWSYALLEAVETFVGVEWYLATSPSNCSIAAQGKVRWIEAVLGRTFNRYYLCSHKHNLASPGSVLIDDSLKNVKDFECYRDSNGNLVTTGGHGILFPALHNRLYGQAHDPVPYVKRELERLCI